MHYEYCESQHDIEAFSKRSKLLLKIPVNNIRHRIAKIRRNSNGIRINTNEIR